MINCLFKEDAVGRRPCQRQSVKYVSIQLKALVIAKISCGVHGCEVGKLASKTKLVKQEIIHTWSLSIITSFYGSLPPVLTSCGFEDVI